MMDFAFKMMDFVFKMIDFNSNIKESGRPWGTRIVRAETAKASDGC